MRVAACLMVAGAMMWASAAASAAPLDSWTGFYFGINGGYAKARGGMDLNASQTSLGGIGDATVVPGHLDTGASGPVVGAHLGYNWVVASRFLAGFEADLVSANLSRSESRSGSSSFVLGPALFTSTENVGASQSLAWFGTVRGRLGFLATPDFLFYGTGGLAYGHVKASLSLNEASCISFIGTICNSATGSDSISSTRAGWAAGAGTEWKINDRWAFRAEYLHIDLGSATLAPAMVTSSPGPSPVTVNTTARFGADMVRVGLSYKPF